MRSGLYSRILPTLTTGENLQALVAVGEARSVG
jgi:hypothetical protein